MAVQTCTFRDATRSDYLVAPDYPGFGHSDWPDPKQFAYTFDHYAEVMIHFTEALGLSRCTLYLQDYGGPVGFRMALAHPDRIEALIVQEAVAHNEGLGANWKTRRAFWADRAANESAPRTNLLSLPARAYRPARSAGSMPWGEADGGKQRPAGNKRALPRIRTNRGRRVGGRRCHCGRVTTLAARTLPLAKRTFL
ncbi:MAG TPA: alpha/beta fold hydrolase [Chthoniobacterales bacterium]